MTNSFPHNYDVPVGFRFRPTDEELVNHYLKKKLLGNDSIVNNVIAEVDVCKFEPWDLPACSLIKSNDPEWFFFCPRDYKYANSKRFNRRTQCGYWKATGLDRKIKVRGTDNVIGIKKTLVFYNGCVPGVKSNWVIHEYHSATFHDNQRTFVLCRLMKKAEKKAEEEIDRMICDEGEPSRHMSSDHENQETVEGIPDVISGTLLEKNMEPMFQEPHQAENYFPFSTYQPSISENENEVSLSNSGFYDSESGHIDMQSPFETIEEENQFINSMLNDGYFVNSEKIRHTFVNFPVQSKSLRMIDYGSSDTDAELVSKPCRNVLDTSTAFLEHPSSSEYYASFRNDFGGLEASSCDSSADKPLEMINCFEISSAPSTLRRNKNQYHPRPATFMSKRAASRISQT
ncbi:putative transcription factor NAM family [Medicago truncatula]|uniref:NAC transcription factor-like protein n=1 Tax=Medicago truncatula TaxID=3880 RepID=G7ZZI3_MEDTR|nr:NAC domain-containing protein 69 [Medicago truncatula]KEH18539.1 NAC transcription factor-like protein [Medicago truncatula]RHN39610.1 putative transcription factor NAM family [Medicago truncatula]